MEDSHAILERSSQLLRTGAFKAALAELEQVPEADRWTESGYWTLMSVARLGLEEFSDAIAAANWGLSIQPHDARLFAIRFEAERAAGLIPAAERSILVAIRLRPQDVHYQVAYAWLLASAGQLAKAERVNVAARRLAEDDVDVAWQAAELARLQGNDAEAVGRGYRMLEASAPEPFKRALLGQLLVELERTFEGADHVRQSANSGVTGREAQDFAATLGHWLVRPYRIIERIGPVRAPALLLCVAILLLAFNLVTAALVVAAVMWILFLYPSIAIPYASWRRKRDDNRQRRETM
jgi:tetratricopeptide (TPR) repeat protein